MSPASIRLLDELRDRTRSHHHTLDSSAFTRALANGTVAPAAFGAMLKATFIIRDTLERALAEHASPLIASVWQPIYRRAPLLDRDLRHWQPTEDAPELSQALQAAAAVAEQCRRRADQHPVSLLGWLYVMEGSMKGAPVVCRLARRAFALDGDEGLSYLLSADDTAADTWREFSARMNALAVDADERERLVGAAVELFDGLIEVFRALQPGARSLNPEAGHHPIPSDPRELAAAERAGDTCWQVFPYLDARYGTRGRRFTSSDSAWLVTLAELDQQTANQQVLWLGTVIGARGLPRIILERQLRMLHEELCAAVPARSDVYTRLLEASRLLHSRRTSVLSEDHSDAIAAGFEARVAHLPDRVPHVGVLIVSAVLDEHDQVPLSVESLSGWLTDPSRFSEAWIRIVDETISDVRGLMPHR